MGTNQKSRNTKLFKCLISIVCRGNDWFFFTVHVGAKKLSMNICKANIEVSFCRYFSCLKKDFMVKSVFAILTDGGIIQHNHGRNANVVQFVDLSIIFPSLSWLNQKKKINASYIITELQYSNIISTEFQFRIHSGKPHRINNSIYPPHAARIFSFATLVWSSHVKFACFPPVFINKFSVTIFPDYRERISYKIRHIS